jgi:hypothetical protein
MKIMKRLIRDEKGQVMVLAVILLLVGGLLVSSLLSYMGNGLLNGRVYEKRTAELYAADAGVEDAVWKIQNSVVGDDVYYLYCGQGNHTLPYNITGGVNSKSVAVTITYVNNTTYSIVSTATGNGSGTQIKAYVTGVSQYGDYSGILNQIATSQGEVDIANKVTLVYPTGCGPKENYMGAWPPPGELSAWYWQDVKNVTPYSSGTIDLNGVNMTKGPLCRNGTLEIMNSSNTPATLKLTGTLYITGETLIGTTGKDFTLDLNGQTIFVSSNVTGNHKAIIMGGKCTIEGPGAIIAVGDFEFKPKEQAGGESKPIFVLSVLGTTTMQPSGNYYGAIAGSVEVEIQAGTKPTITYPTGGFGGYGLNFPVGGTQYLVYSIYSWEVNQQ